MIRIISGWSNPGGSTTAFINLTNALNEVGYETIFCGPHNWHLNKCRAEQTVPGTKLKIHKDDSLIIHFMNKFQVRPPVKKFILSSHEQDILPIKNLNYKIFDKIHFVSTHQKEYHDVDHPHFILPNILDDLKPGNKPNSKVGGIIGSIDGNKRVHQSIRNALKDGCEKVLIFGNISDPWYWQNKVKCLIDGSKVVYCGYVDDKQKIYNMITDVYHSSKLETWGYIKGECKLTNTNYHGNNSTNGYWEMDKEKIIDSWTKELA